MDASVVDVWAWLPLASTTTRTGNEARNRRHYRRPPLRQSVPNESKLPLVLLVEVLETLRTFGGFCNDCVLLLNDAGKILAANDRAQSLYGYSDSELGALTLAGLGPSPAGVSAAIRQALEAGGAVFELSQQRRDGTKFSTEISLRTVALEDGAVYVAIVRDITGRAAREGAGAAAMALAHDLNNLLTVINGHADMLLSQLQEGDPVRESVVEIARAGDRAAGLVPQLRALGPSRPAQTGRAVAVQTPAESPSQGEAGHPAPALAPVVLVVDDEAGVRDYFQRVLDGAGFRVLVATNGDEALHLARTHSLDVVLGDARARGHRDHPGLAPGKTGRQDRRRLGRV
jgi:PAS domain S-box-containing protein